MWGTSQYKRRMLVCIFRAHRGHSAYSLWTHRGLAWTYLHTICRQRFDYAILCTHRKTEWHTTSRALLLTRPAMTLTGLKALEGRWGVKFFKRSLPAVTVHSHSCSKFQSALLTFLCFFLFFPSMLLMCIHKVFLKDSRAQWPDE